MPEVPALNQDHVHDTYIFLLWFQLLPDDFEIKFERFKPKVTFIVILSECVSCILFGFSVVVVFIF